jgi:hypothetical protein
MQSIPLRTHISNKIDFICLYELWVRRPDSCAFAQQDSTGSLVKRDLVVRHILDLIEQTIRQDNLSWVERYEKSLVGILCKTAVSKIMCFIPLLDCPFAYILSTAKRRHE